MEFLVYRSRALVAPGSVEADRIVAESARNNARAGLTGFLHHEPGLFVQYVEGRAEVVEAAWRRILADPRHDNATMIGMGPVRQRFFGGWALGYSDDGVARFADFLEEAAGKLCADAATPHETIWFLRGACQRLDLGLTA
jgi:hypothetical protein